MPNQKNIQLTQDLSKKLAISAGVVIVDYKGLTHRKLENLRLALEETGAKLQVIKNSLLKIAIRKSSPAGLRAIEDLTGPSAVIFLPQEFIVPIKKLFDFFKQNDLPVVKLGQIGSQIVDEQYLDQLSKLPTHPELMSELLSRLQRPIWNLLYILNANGQNLVRTISAIKKTKGGEQNG